ncbi:hypothetical protein [[Clostridium] polysaccharolyticum]|uniref:Prolyl oligopeptidase family protein n=1 Tax=[Clostridium] polysaccharolyticum TaxID=29364 RepID=A0A1I0C3Q1_9FIRM|nr:hypothetical protein [[Clostridium] polysaccharolyticum]SET14087.1 hypothetical protein SAMN04487772_1099 [[Clostridium] polysaccharolyticum]
MEYKGVQFQCENIHIEQYLVLDVEQEISFDLFSLEIPSRVQDKINLMEEQKEMNFQVFEDTNIYYANDLSRFGEQNTVYLYAKVLTGFAQKAFLERDMPGFSKLWLNGRLIDACSERQQAVQYQVQLKSGINHIVLAFHRIRKSVFPPYVYLNLLPYENINHECFPFRRKEIYQKEHVLLPSQYDDKEQMLWFFLIPHNSDRQEYSIIIEKNQSVYDEIIIEPFKPYKVSVPLQENELMQVKAVCDVFTYAPEIYIKLPEKKVEQIVEQAIHYIAYHKECKEECFGRIAKIQNDLTFEKDIYQLCQELMQIFNGKPLEEKIIKSVYYLSDLDLSYQEMQVMLPADYDRDKTYPVIFCLGILDFDYIKLEELPKEHIIVNLSGRGILGGSYISEAAYFEGIEKIKQLYEIDTDRIFLIGKSNGGYGVWSLIQNYPDLAAAAFPISGYPYEPNIRNVANLDVYNVISNMDSCYTGKETVLKEQLGTNDRYKEIREDGLLHHTVTNFSIYDIEAIFQGKIREEYPKEIYFRTERNRNIKAYWISIWGIQKGQKSGLVKAKIQEDGNILLITKHTEGITVVLPPEVNKRKFYVNVNGNLVWFYKYNRNEIEIRFHEKGSFKINPDRKPERDMAKGNGLLDVYTGSVRIVVPKWYSDKEMSVAKKFQSPKSNGYYNSIHVCYPIYQTDTIKEEQKSKNLILINLDRKQLEEQYGISLNRYISFEQEGFFYEGKEYCGQYCVMQVIENPSRKESSILLVNTNDETMFRHNMFLRKIAIPFVVYGMHEYWNNVALIQWQDDFYGVYEWGNVMKPL